MAKHDIVLLNTTSSGFETDLGSNVARIKGTADDLFQVRDGSGLNKLAVSSVEDSMIVSGDLTLTGNLSSSLSSTASFGKIDVTNLVGDASQMTDVNQIGHVSSSAQLASRISGAFQHGFELEGENRLISGSATSTGSFTRVFANIYSGDASDMFNVNEAGHFSGSAQLASNISGSFTSGFELSAGSKISGSATSTGSFGKVEFSGQIAGNAAAVTINQAGFFSGSAQLASNISGSFNKGFEFSGALNTTEIVSASFVGVSGSAFAYAGNATTMSISSICGSDFDYRLKDEITAGTIKATSYGMGSWSAGPNRIVATGFGGAAGTQNSYLAMGGYTPSGTDATEKYNGSSWAVSAKLTIADCAFSAAGTQNAVAVFNGHGDPDGSEIYNGATFSETANRTNGRRNTGAAGTQNASIVFGGMGPSPTNNVATDKTENFDGNAFTALNDMNSPNSVMASGGTQNAAIAAFGYNYPAVPGENITQLWNGTSWSAGANTIQSRRAVQGHGTQNHFIGVGGQTNQCVANTEEWNGTSWSEQNNLPTAKAAAALAGHGLGSAAIFAGGFAPNPTGATNTVEFWNAGLSTTGSFGRVNVGGALTGDASQTTGLASALPTNTLSGSAQIASKISGSFNKGFNVDGTIEGTTDLSYSAHSTLPYATIGSAMWGTVTNAISIAGGAANSPFSSVEHHRWNGSSWSEGADLPNTRASIKATGTQDAGILFGGSPNTAQIGIEYNHPAFSYTPGAAVDGAPACAIGVGGTQNAAFMGLDRLSPSKARKFQSYNGTNFSEEADSTNAWTGGSVNDVKSGAMEGTENSAITWGGYNAPYTIKVEEYDGTSWSAAQDKPSGARGIDHGLGTTTAQITTFSGWNPATLAHEYNSGVWRTLLSPPTPSKTGGEASAAGTAGTAGVRAGGYTNATNDQAEQFDYINPTTGSFKTVAFGSTIAITNVSNLTGVPSSEGFISGSKQIASKISGSFTKGFEFTGTISGSATSTGSFGRVVANTYNADASNVTGFTLPSGLASGSAGFASQISGSFKGGFEMIEGGVISSSIKFISSSISSSTTEIGMGQGNDGSTSMSIASASFSIGLANFNNLKINDGAVTSISHRTAILNTGILSKGEKFISGSLRGLPRFRQDVLISGSATSTGSYAKLRAESITVKDMVGDVRKSISGSMNHATYTSGSFRPVGTDKPIKIPVFDRGHTVNTQQFTASGSMENQKYRTQPGQLFIDNFGRLNMTVQTGSMVTVAGAWEQGPQTIIPNNGYAATAGMRDAFIMAGPYLASGSAIYDGIGWQRTSDVTTRNHGNRAANCGIGTVNAAFIMRYMSGSQPSNPTGKYAPYPNAPAHAVLQEFWDGVGWYRGPDGNTPTNNNVKRGGTAGKVGSVNSHIVFNGDDYPTSVGTATWNGVTWQDVGPHTPTIRDNGGGFGGVYDGVVAGGAAPNNTCVDEWNGTSWATATALPTAQDKGMGVGTQTAGMVTGGSYPYRLVQEYNGTSWSESTSLPANMQNHGSGGTAAAAFAASTGATYLWTGGFVTGSITTNTDKGYNPFSQNPTGRYLLTKKLQANLSPSHAGGTATTGSSAGYGGGY